MIKKLHTYLIFSILCNFLVFNASAQEEPSESIFKEPKTKLWLNTYGNIRIGKRLFWVAQTHFRFEESKNTPYIGQIGQLYNRHAIGYIYSKYFNVSLGGVLRLNFNTNETPANTDRNLIPEWRIWHQYMFAQPISSWMFYHRIRIEHRWTSGFQENSSFIFRNRWRYMFKAKVPLNSHKFQSKTFYVSPEAEIILQSGKQVVGSILEDLRLHASFGYILNPRMTLATGIMYSQGQSLSNAAEFNQNWTLRFHLYFSPDFRKVKNKLPAIHLDD